MSTPPGRQAFGNGVNQPGSTLLAYTVGDWDQMEDLEFAEIPMEVLQDPGEAPAPEIVQAPPTLSQEREEIFDFIEGQKAKSTVQKTNRDVLRFKRYLAEKNEHRNPEDLDPKVLAIHIGSFIRGLSKADGSEYEPGTITSVYCSIDRYLRKKGYPHVITKDDYFKCTKEVVEAKRKLVKASGKGNLPNRAKSLTLEEEDQLWTRGGFSHEDPTELLAGLWYLLSLNFGFRGNDESRQLKFGDLTLGRDGQGDTYLELKAERLMKTRKGGQGDGHRAFTPKAWANGGRRCPVFFYEQYCFHRPDSMKAPDAPFYLNVNFQRRVGAIVWFKAGAMGHNNIGLIRAGIPRPLTNHCVRKISVERLLNFRIDPTIVAQHSGHKNVASINNYAMASEYLQKRMASALSRGDLPLPKSPVSKF